MQNCPCENNVKNCFSVELGQVELANVFFHLLSDEEAAEQLAIMAYENGSHGFMQMSLDDSAINASFLHELDISNDEFNGIISVDRSQG